MRRSMACRAVLVSVAAPWLAAPSLAQAPTLRLQEFATPARSAPHDAVPDRFGLAWYSGQGNGTVGRLDPTTGDVTVIPIAPGSAPHGILMGPDDAVWITDGGLNAIVRIDRDTLGTQVFPLPGPRANLNTLTFDHRGVLW